MTVTLRQETAAGATTKGSSLTYTELDNNFVHLLRQGSVTVRADSGTDQTLGEADKDSILNFVGGTNATTTISSDSAGETVITVAATDTGITDVVSDTSPQLGGDLDVNGQSIVSTSNASINITPNGTGDVVLGTMTFDTDQTIGAGEDNYVLTYDNASGKISLEAAAGGGIADVVDDTTPQLGGDLDAQGNKIQNPVLEDYAETIYAIGSNDSPTITISNGNVQTVTITSGLALPAFADAAAGQSVTLLVDGTGSATGTANHIFAGGNKTLTNTSVVSIFYDGTDYYTSIATDFQA
jgi:hypothetical protein